MKMTIKRCALLLLALLLALQPIAAMAADDGYHTSYTYNYDYWGDIRESPDAYQVETVLTSASLGLEVPLKKPSGMYCQGNMIYLVDTGNNRVIEILRDGSTYTVTRIIDTVTVPEGMNTPATFNGPTDVYADPEGNIYVADKENHRVVMCNKDLVLLKTFEKPGDSAFSGESGFLPDKIAVDSAGRVYVKATNVNKGLVKFEAAERNDSTTNAGNALEGDKKFSGFIGANKVSYDIGEYIWKQYFSTAEQRAQQAAFVPTEYENIYMDAEGFIYATNTSFSEWDLKSDVAKPIRRLNGVGDDILIKNDRYPPIGDLYWVESSTDKSYGPSLLTDITVLGNDIYVAVDKTRGRLFGYDAQGVMLWAFGTKGNMDGAFLNPVALDHMGYDLIVLDSTKCSLTVFTPTEYGSLIFQANEEYLRGEYEVSAATWEKVLMLNANYTSAFIGIGRSMLREGNYEEAMEYFKMSHDRINYGRAFRLYRKVWVEKNIIWIVIVLVVLIVLSTVKKSIQKMKWEVEAYERQQVRH